MKIDAPENVNYCATVVKIVKIFPLKNCDNIVATSIFGSQVLLGKDHTEGEVGIYFPAESQLSDIYCYENNLYRHADKNKFPDQKGYMEDNRRVRAIKFRGNTSNGFFMPLSSLKWTGVNLDILNVGDEFDTLNGKEICRKYTVPKKEQRSTQVANRGFVRADKKFMPEHIDTENFFKNYGKMQPDTEVIVTQKIHGTSIRIANTIVNRKLSFVERVAKFFGANIAKTEYTYLYGSRKVIKDANNPNQNHFYDTDIWTSEGKKLDGLLPENYIVYAELIGWTPDGKEIQKNYTYGLPHGTCEMYIYRIAIVNERGHITDLSWEQVKEFCNKNGLKFVPELSKTTIGKLSEDDFKYTKFFLDTRYFEKGYRNALYLGENKDIVDEGICVRVEGLIPSIFKAKSPLFLEHETKLLDTGEEDLESSQNNNG